ncbi:hypothetical protein SAMN05421813_11446 [Daejeonella rubra]|uniref:Uncharacterized protein n=1 Tax=Daejeonella rubra TaxID=990371 RepID=A0A1G9TUL2_9SPHI|nr:hypothetical protein SAMN05421813_11446 [Daejeonella rubra]
MPGEGTYFSLQLEKEAKEPRLPGISCKITLYPIGVIQAVLREVKYMNGSATLLWIT